MNETRTAAEFYFTDKDYYSSAAGSSERMIHFGTVRIISANIFFANFSNTLTTTPPGMMHSKIVFLVVSQNQDFPDGFNRHNYDKDDLFLGRLVFSDKSEFNFSFTFTGLMIENKNTSYQDKELEIITAGSFEYLTRK